MCSLWVGEEKEGSDYMVEAVIVNICRLSFRRHLQVGKFLQGNLIKQKLTIKRGSAKLDFFVNVPKMSSSTNAVYNLIESETHIHSEKNLNLKEDAAHNVKKERSIPHCHELLVSFDLVTKLYGCCLQFTNKIIGLVFKTETQK